MVERLFSIVHGHLLDLNSSISSIEISFQNLKAVQKFYFKTQMYKSL